jgi:hypothetical protein
MPKHLRHIVEKVSEGKDTKFKGVKSSKTSKLNVSDLNDSPGNQEFASKHTRQDHEDRVGNGDEDYKGNTKQASELRHANVTKEKSKSSYRQWNEDKEKEEAARQQALDVMRTDKEAKDEAHKIMGKKPEKDSELTPTNKVPGVVNRYTLKPVKESSCDYDAPLEPKDKPKKGQKVLLGGKKGLKEREMTSAEKAKEKKLKSKYDPSDMKASMIDQYGPEKGKEVYFATIRNRAMSKKK